VIVSHLLALAQQSLLQRPTSVASMLIDFATSWAARV